MTTLQRAASIHGGCDRHWSHGTNNVHITAETISRKSRDIPLHAESAIERTEIESEGSELSFAMRPDTSQKKLNRWQAALIYITNQVGVGILGLPSVMQTLGLIPGIICIVGLGMSELNHARNTANFSLNRARGHVYSIRSTAVRPKVSGSAELRGLLPHHWWCSFGICSRHWIRAQPDLRLFVRYPHDEHRAQ
jgi:hypothetical protein